MRKYGFFSRPFTIQGILKTGILSLTLITLYGCPPEEKKEEELVEYTFEYNCVNTVTDCEPVDFMNGGNVLVSDLDYAAQSHYHDYTFVNTVNTFYLQVLIPEGSGTPLKITNPFTIYNSEPFTFYLIGRKSDSSLKAIYTQDSYPVTNPGKSRIRIIHASPECPDIDIRLIHISTQDTISLSSREYAGRVEISATDPNYAFNLINSGDYDVIYLDHQTGTELYRSFYTAPDTKALTLVLIGNPNGFWPYHLQDIPVWH